MPEPETRVRTYVLAFAALLVLTALTVGLAHVDLEPFGMAVALLIAATKTLVVMLFFMHVRTSTPLVRLFAGAAFLWLFVLIALTLSDVYTRGWTG